MARGGARPGAGRKPSPTREIARASKKIKAIGAALILAQINEIEAWKELLTATRTVIVGEGEPLDVPDYKTRLEALKYLTDRRDGKPKQAIVGGEEGDSPVKMLLIGAKEANV